MMRKFVLIFILITSAVDVSAQLSPLVDSIPMRDGKKLAADIYIPSGCSSCPVILIQTPYNRLFYRYQLPLGVGLDINNSPYVFVITDWRGFYGSGAAFDVSADRGEDGYDVVDWISMQSWCDGNVGTWGPSALGKVQFQTAREQHPAHKCAVPLVAAPQFNYSEFYPGGVYRTEYVQQLDALGYGLSAIILANQVYNTTWVFVETENFYPSSITIPFFMIGGWYDHGTDPVIDFFNAIRTASAVPVRDQHRLLIGPWAHGGSGAAYVGSAAQGELSYPGAEGWNDSLALLFFDYHLRGTVNGWNSTEYITYFQMGEDTWNISPVWPPSDVSLHRLYLHDNDLLASGIPVTVAGSSSFTYDPRDPSPTIGGATLRLDLDQGPYDQSPVVESRTDLLFFESPVLGADVIMKGKSSVHLFVSTDRTDTDFAVRLTDVYPDGRSMLLADGIKRLRFRDGYSASDTSSAVPGNVYEIDVELPAVAHTFLSGHKIRIDITSSNYPRYDPNLNNGGNMYVSGDTLIAANTIWHNSLQPSYAEFLLQDFIGSVDENKIYAEIFPNPFSDEISIEGMNGEKMVWEIYDVSGRLINSGQVMSGKIIPAIYYPGVYILKLINDDQIICKKIIRK